MKCKINECNKKIFKECFCYKHYALSKEKKRSYSEGDIDLINTRLLDERIHRINNIKHQIEKSYNSNYDENIEINTNIEKKKLLSSKLKSKKREKIKKYSKKFTNEDYYPHDFLLDNDL